MSDQIAWRYMLRTDDNTHWEEYRLLTTGWVVTEYLNTTDQWYAINRTTVDPEGLQSIFTTASEAMRRVEDHLFNTPLKIVDLEEL
jgi:hypothetical protein